MPILVQTPARLHLGQIDLNGSLGRIFGGVGVAIENPSVRLVFEKNNILEVVGDNAELVRKQALRYFDYYGLPHQAKVTVLSLIPGHVGLGSGTQLRLAVAGGLTRLLGKDIPIKELSGIMNHGESRSGIGTSAFAGGGFIVDGGFKAGESPVMGKTNGASPVLFHKEFPKEWLALIMIPESRRGLHGKAEKDVFKNMPPMSEESVGKICRHLVMQLLPALMEKDSANFGHALDEIQRIIGGYFARVQGGIFSSQISSEVACFCMKNGAFATSQSSWGPALYAFVEGEEQVNMLASKVKDYLQANNWKGKVFVTRPDNRGAVIKNISESELKEIMGRDIYEKDIAALGR